MSSLRHINHRRALLSASIALALSATANAQEVKQTDDKEVETVLVVGSQIKGASISDALSTSVLDNDAIQDMGVGSMDELLDMLPENGQNFFNEASSISGGVNAARGDVAAFNLRSVGTGNTLVLLNGRRMVNAATYQTEVVGGGFVPVNSVNANTIAPNSLARVEVLRDGASAIYGADAVAGVINNVIDTDFDGFEIQARYTMYENLPRDDESLRLKWGTDLNDGMSNITVSASYLNRGRVNSQDDIRWSNSDFRHRLPEDSPWASGTSFRNDSANSLYGQFDMSGRIPGFTDSRGEFEVYPVGDERCTYEINDQVCGAPDGQGTVRYNLNENRDLVSAMERYNLMVSFTHSFSDNLEAYTEFLGYESTSHMYRHPTASFSSSKLTVGEDNPYNPFGVDLLIDFYRFAEKPRVVQNDGSTYRFLQGLRGDWGNWSWDTAVTYSEATKDDITHNRVSNTLMQEALNDSSMDAYNPFSGGVDSNIERALVSVYRKGSTSLASWDAKFSNPEIFNLPAGPVGVMVGAEVRREAFKDDRDPRLDGTIQFTDGDGDTYPFVSDVVNSSPTPDNEGDRTTSSLFTEFQIPLLDDLDIQLAARYENFSDVGDTVVGKVAFGYNPLDWLLVRGSWSQAYRVPNLVTVNEEIVARASTIDDYVCEYAALYGGDPDQDVLDCRYSSQRIAQGSEELVPEKSDNSSIGFVITPIENLDITFDYWQIEKEDTIGLLGNDNNTLLDLVYRLEAGNANCSSVVGNTAVDRGEADPDESAYYEAAGLCPAGSVNSINDNYANLDTRTIGGWDLGIYYGIETSVGSFDFRYNFSKLTEFEQVAGGDAAVIVDAQESGLLPPSFPVEGFADLLGIDGNQEDRSYWNLGWRTDMFAVSVRGNTVGEFYQSSLTLSDGTQYEIPSMTTYDVTFTGYFDVEDYAHRLRMGIKNVTDERAPLADDYFGYYSDAHRDLGRHMYLDYTLSF